MSSSFTSAKKGLTKWDRERKSQKCSLMGRFTDAKFPGKLSLWRINHLVFFVCLFVFYQSWILSNSTDIQIFLRLQLC